MKLYYDSVLVIQNIEENNASGFLFCRGKASICVQKIKLIITCGELELE